MDNVTTEGKDSMVDLGLSYESAMHGVQSAIAAFYMDSAEPKHLRVGVDSCFVTDRALANLLIDKGVFTTEEYVEYCRLAANMEVHERQEENPGYTFR